MTIFPNKLVRARGLVFGAWFTAAPPRPDKAKSAKPARTEPKSGRRLVTDAAVAILLWGVIVLISWALMHR